MSTSFTTPHPSSPVTPLAEGPLGSKEGVAWCSTISLLLWFSPRLPRPPTHTTQADLILPIVTDIDPTVGDDSFLHGLVALKYVTLALIRCSLIC